MPQTIGSNYVVTIPVLGDEASIVKAFQYYHRGNEDGTLGANGIESHLISIGNRIGTIENTVIGYPYTSGSSINSRLNTLETNSGTVADKYIKAGPQSNTDVNLRNIITPQNSSTIPLIIQGVNGATSTDLQQWIIGGETTPKVRISAAGRLLSFDGTSVAEVATISGTQELTGKVITNSTLDVGATTAFVDLTYRGKFVNFTSTSPKTLTVPEATKTPQTSYSIPVGTSVTITNLAATGNLTIAAEAGVTLLSQDSRRIIFPYGSAHLFKVATNTWTINFMSKERQIFIQQTDPGAAALDGDIWYKY